ncbi:hypothetical protein Tco_0766438 [Tanacetum coccineum]
MKTSVATGTTAVERGDVRWLCKVKPDCALYGIAQSGSCLDEVFKFRLSVLDSKGSDSRFDTPYPPMWDTAYWAFLGVRTTFDIFQNLRIYVGTDTPYLLDGYGVLM